ncbi:MAG: hypothetical protein K0U64_09550, partial [Actinomycetia bacterium]|nr:hypothetical protein [Actinomycetes bacterium]
MSDQNPWGPPTGDPLPAKDEDPTVAPSSEFPGQAPNQDAGASQTESSPSDASPAQPAASDSAPDSQPVNDPP